MWPVAAYLDGAVAEGLAVPMTLAVLVTPTGLDNNAVAIRVPVAVFFLWN